VNIAIHGDAKKEICGFLLAFFASCYSSVREKLVLNCTAKNKAIIGMTGAEGMRDG